MLLPRSRSSSANTDDRPAGLDTMDEPLEPRLPIVVALGVCSIDHITVFIGNDRVASDPCAGGRGAKKPGRLGSLALDWGSVSSLAFSVVGFLVRSLRAGTRNRRRCGHAARGARIRGDSLSDEPIVADHINDDEGGHPCLASLTAPLLGGTDASR